jgi:hypothetical protein
MADGWRTEAGWRASSLLVVTDSTPIRPCVCQKLLDQLLLVAVCRNKFSDSANLLARTHSCMVPEVSTLDGSEVSGHDLIAQMVSSFCAPLALFSQRTSSAWFPSFSLTLMACAITLSSPTPQQRITKRNHLFEHH